jgi:protein-tyrosine phosphatase
MSDITPLNSNDGMIRILMVCLGNICRSPTAHGVFQQRILESNLQGRVLVDSAGTGNWHIGSPPDPRAAEAAGARGYHLDNLVARQVTPQDYFEFDYLLAMDRDNLVSLQSACPPASSCRIELFLDYSPRDESEVPDPYYSGEEGFELVLDMVEEAAGGLLQALVRRHLQH